MGIKKGILLLVFLLVIFSNIILADYLDSFESYSVGDFLAQKSDSWNPWSDSSSGGKQDAIITNKFHFDGQKSLKIQKNDDIYLDLGNLQKGTYVISFQIYVPSGDNSAKFNIHHIRTDECAFEVTLKKDETGFTKYNGDKHEFDYKTNSWNEIKYIIDLDADEVNFFLNDNPKDSWDFSYQSNDQRATNNLGDLDFYYSEGIYYVDSLKYECLSCSSDQETEEDPNDPCSDTDGVCDLEICTIQNDRDCCFQKYPKGFWCTNALDNVNCTDTIEDCGNCMTGYENSTKELPPDCQGKCGETDYICPSDPVYEDETFYDPSCLNYMDKDCCFSESPIGYPRGYWCPNVLVKDETTCVKDPTCSDCPEGYRDQKNNLAIECPYIDGNGICEPTENCMDNSGDCPICCGDGYCDKDNNEDISCYEDCSAIITCPVDYQCSCTIPENTLPDTWSGVPSNPVYCCIDLQRQGSTKTINVNKESDANCAAGISSILNLDLESDDESAIDWRNGENCAEGTYDLLFKVGSNTGSSCGNEDGNCTIKEVMDVFYDENQFFCEECQNKDLTLDGNARGVWSDLVYGGMDYYKDDFTFNNENIYHGTVGTCCGDDEQDDADWARNFCYYCHTGENQAEAVTTSGISSRMWYPAASRAGDYYIDYNYSGNDEDIEAFQNFQNENFCCGDDYSSTVSDCGMFQTETLCWRSNDIFQDDYTEFAYGNDPDFPKDNIARKDFTQDPEHYQWYFTKPGDVESKIIGLECKGKASYEVNNNYANKEIDLMYLGSNYDDGEEQWTLCDDYAFSISDDFEKYSSINKTNYVQQFNRDVPNPVEGSNSLGESNFICSMASFKGDEIDKSDPVIYECMLTESGESGIGGIDNHYFGGTHVGETGSTTFPEGYSLPFFGAYSAEHSGSYDDDLIWTKMTMQEFFKPDPNPDTPDDMFPKFSTVDALAYAPGGKLDDCDVRDIEALCSDVYGCLLIADGSNLWVYNTKGQLRKSETDEISEEDIDAMTFIPKGGLVTGKYPRNDMIFGSGYDQFFSFVRSDKKERYDDINEIFDICDSLDAHDVVSIAYLPEGYYDNAYPRLMIQKEDGLYELEFIGDECITKVSSDNKWNMDNNQQMLQGAELEPGDVDSFEAVWSSKGEPYLFLPKNTPGIIVTKDNDIYEMLAAPIHCIGDKWTRNLDTRAAEKSCNEYTTTQENGYWSFGGGFHDDVCCGEPEDNLETFFKSSGLCFRGSWVQPYAGNTYDVIGSFLKDPLLNTKVDGTGDAVEVSNELKELLLFNYSDGVSIKGCATTDECHCSQDKGPDDCCEKIEEMGNITYPYQGNTNLLYKWIFDSNADPWEFEGGEGSPSFMDGAMTLDVLEPMTVQHYIYNIKCGDMHNFRFDFKVDGDKSVLEQEMQVFYRIYDNSGNIKFEKNESYHYHNLDEWEEAVLVFELNDSFCDVSNYHHYVGINLSVGDESYRFSFREPRLATNDFINDIKVGDGNAHKEGSYTTDFVKQVADFCDMEDINRDNDWDYYCSFRETWEKVPESWKDKMKIENKDVDLKFIPKENWWNISDSTLVDKAIQIAGCCLQDQCWTGKTCVNSTHNVGRPTLYPNESSRTGYRCLHGDWIWTEPKYDWNNDDRYYGYCEYEDQCLVDVNGNYSANGHPEDYSEWEKYDYFKENDYEYPVENNDNPICINDSQYIKDYYCNGGNWTTRTYYLIDRMLELTDSGMDFTLFCDNFEHTLNINQTFTNELQYKTYDGLSCELHFDNTTNNPERFVKNAYILSDFSDANEDCIPDCMYRESNMTASDDAIVDRLYPCTNNFCVLNWKEGSEYKTMIGVGLNQPIDARNFPFMNLLGTGSRTYSDSCSGDFGQCSSTNYYDVMYDKDKELVIFTPKDNGFPSESSWLGDLLKSTMDSIRDIFWDSYKNDQIMIDGPPIQLNISADYSRFYLANYGSDRIKALISATSFRNYKLPSEYIGSALKKGSGMIIEDSYIQYGDYPLVCESLSNLSVQYWGGYSACLTESNTYVLSQDASFYDKIWTRLTAQLRPGR